jgi:hypothetical protein
MYHFQDFPGIRWCDLKETVHEENFWTLISFVALGIWSEGNFPGNIETTAYLSFTTMLQHTGQFWSMISQQRIMWQHWINPHIFTRSLVWNQHWRGCIFYTTDLKKRRKSWKYFYKWLQGMFPTALQFLTEVFICRRGLFWRKYRLNDCTLYAFLRNKDIPGIFWSYHVF